jgi:thiamine pyrophosphokinase
LRAVIFANGSLNPPVTLSPEDFIIAADGGARHCLALGLVPAVVIGDLDSLSSAELEALKAQGAEIIQFPVRKDFTDLELALKQARSIGADEILILGALGKRWDQTLANVMLPAAFPDLAIRLMDGDQEFFYLRAGEKISITGRPGDTLSLIPLGSKAHGITTNQLEYPLHGEDLPLGSTRGVSNILLAEEAQISLDEGFLLCVVIHQPDQAINPD